MDHKFMDFLVVHKFMDFLVVHKFMDFLCFINLWISCGS